MDENDEIFIVAESISNVVNTISELDDLIKRDRNELRVNELKMRRELLIEVLQLLRQDLENKSIHELE